MTGLLVGANAAYRLSGVWGPTREDFAKRGKTGISATQPHGQLRHAETVTAPCHQETLQPSRTMPQFTPTANRQIAIAI